MKFADQLEQKSKEMLKEIKGSKKIRTINSNPIRTHKILDKAFGEANKKLKKREFTTDVDNDYEESYSREKLGC